MASEVKIVKIWGPSQSNIPSTCPSPSPIHSTPEPPAYKCDQQNSRLRAPSRVREAAAGTPGTAHPHIPSHQTPAPPSGAKGRPLGANARRSAPWRVGQVRPLRQPPSRCWRWGGPAASPDWSSSRGGALQGRANERWAFSGPKNRNSGAASDVPRRRPWPVPGGYGYHGPAEHRCR